VKADESKITGKLINVDEEAITLEYTEGKNKKAVVHQQQVPLNEIKSAFVQIKF
jgi:ribosome maturation factor RimP